MEVINKILIVDDNKTNLFLYSKLIKEPGRIILQAESGQGALNIIEKEKDISLILMDIQMPGMNGFEAVKRIKEIESMQDVPIIFITGVYRTDEYVNQGYKLGAYDYLPKPFDNQMLKNKVNIFLKLYNQQKKLEEQSHKLSNQKEFISKVVATVPSVLIVIDIEHKVLTTNITSTDINKKYPSIKIENFLEALEEEIQLNLKTGKQSDKELSIESKEYESPLYFNVIVSCLYVNKNEQHVLLTITDITERKQAEEALRESEEKYRTLIETNPYGIQEIDTSGNITYTNPAYQKMLGYTEEELLGKSILDLFDTDSTCDKLRAYLITLVKDQPQPTTYQQKNLTKSSKVIDQLVDWNYKRDSKGRVIGFTYVITDITERKRAEEELKFLSSVVEQSSEGMAIADLEGKLLFVNRAWAQMHGYKSLEELVDKNLIIFHNQEQLKKDVEPFNQKVKENGFHTGEVGHILKDGTPFPTLMTTTILKDTQGKPIAIAGIARDITEHKKAEIALKYRAEFEGLIANISANFVKFSAKDIDISIKFALQEIGEFRSIDRSYVFLLSDDKTLMSNTHEWCAEGIEPQIETLQNLPVEILPWWMEKLNKFENIYIPDVSRLPPEASAEKEILERQDIQSIVVVPIIYHNSLVGFIGFDYVRIKRRWRSEDMPLLRMAAEIIINAIERQRSERAVKLAHAELDQIFNSATNGLCVIDKNFNLIRVNDTYLDIAGITRNDIIDAKCYDILNSDDCRSDDCPLNIILSGKKYKEQEVIKKRKDGKKIPCLIYAAPFFGADNNLIGIIQDIMDITERKNLETQLVQAQKLESIGQLAAGIAHEINTPMQFVGDNTAFLKDAFDTFYNYNKEIDESITKAEADDDYASLISAIKEKAEELDIEYFSEEIPIAIEQSQDGIKRVSKIVLAMKDFAHPGKKEKSLSNINNGIEVTATISKNEWKYASDLETRLAPNLPPVYCVLDEINQVILSMIVNGAHAIQELLGKEPSHKGKITIETKKTDNYVEIGISDTGNGIPKENLDKIFDPFFTTKKVGKGTGQGLAIVYDIIVNKHSGEILVDSTVGKGTTFTIRLPIT